MVPRSCRAFSSAFDIRSNNDGIDAFVFLQIEHFRNGNLVFCNTG